MNPYSIFTQIFLGLTLTSWLIVLSIFLLSLVVLFFLRDWLLARIFRSPRMANISELALDLLAHTRFYFLLAIAVYIAIQTVYLDARTTNILEIAFLVVVLLQVAVWGNRLIRYFINREINRRMKEESANVAALDLLGLVARITLWIIVILLILENVANFHATTLITSLGITGLAVAIAVQRILGDLFASLSIALDKPFLVGDYIAIGSQQGTVERVGMKSTRIRSLTGEQIIVSNSDLLASRIQNYKRMQERRVEFELHVAGQTPYEALPRIPGLVRQVIDAVPLTRFDRTTLRNFGDNFLNYEVVYFMLTPGYEQYMEAQQTINLAIIKTFEGEGIHLVFR